MQNWPFWRHRLFNTGCQWPVSHLCHDHLCHDHMTMTIVPPDDKKNSMYFLDPKKYVAINWPLAPSVDVLLLWYLHYMTIWSCICPKWVSQSIGGGVVPTLSNRWSTWGVLLDTAFEQLCQNPEDVLQMVQSLQQGKVVKALTMMRVLRLMIAGNPVVPKDPLHMLTTKVICQPSLMLV